jgi:hypothetical protein
MTVYLIKYVNGKPIDWATYEGKSRLDKYYIAEYLAHGYVKVKMKQYMGQCGNYNEIFGEDFTKLSWGKQNERIRQVQEGHDCLLFKHGEINDVYWAIIAEEKKTKRSLKLTEIR